MYGMFSFVLWPERGRGKTGQDRAIRGKTRPPSWPRDPQATPPGTPKQPRQGPPSNPARDPLYKTETYTGGSFLEEVLPPEGEFELAWFI